MMAYADSRYLEAAASRGRPAGEDHRLAARDLGLTSVGASGKVTWCLIGDFPDVDVKGSDTAVTESAGIGGVAALFLRR